MAKYKINILWILLSGIFILSSCVSNKKYIYLQDKGNIKADSNGTMAVQEYAYKLQKGDILYVALSTDDDRLNKIFVPPSSGTMQQGVGVAGTQFYFTGFTINSDGEMELPYVGKIKLVNKTIDQAKNTLEESLRKYFKIFFLQLKVAEFKFSVLGYVNNPGQFFFQQNKVNIMEAIAQAGELQSLAKRMEIQLYRQYPGGVKMHMIDLTDRSIINSSLWYIQPNDVLYVQPLKVRSIGDLSSLQSSFAVIAPLLSSLLLVLNTYILVKNLK
jgi:polysaccharide export outer membrane protein